MNLSTSEPTDFETDHFEDCAAYHDALDICVCDEIERDMRDAFAAMTRESNDR